MGIDGLAIALERIAEEADAQTGVLDLGMLGLLYLPSELFTLHHLRVLNLGSRFFSEGNSHISAASHIAWNEIEQDLHQLADLQALSMLFLSRMPLFELNFLRSLQQLNVLDCSDTQVSDLSPLKDLASLKELHCWDTQVSDLSPLKGLASLQLLDCSDTQVSDLSPLKGLASLQQLYCSLTQVSDLSPLKDLASLKELYCPDTQVSDLSPLKDLASLKVLYCSETQVGDLSPLKSLASLYRLFISRTSVSDLLPLKGLAALQLLYCSHTRVSDLSPLKGLASLRHLNCSDTHVSDLSPLKGLANLQTLDISYMRIGSLGPNFLTRSTIQEIVAFESEIQGFPDEVLSINRDDNCLPAIRSHLADLGDMPVPLDQVKLMILGNGRIGKTQISNRLRDLGYEAEADSTHGVTVTEASIPGGNGTFALWDFGGQDIYHGTHALFLKSRAVFLLVWTPESDNATVHEHGGMRFRNQPLSWWLDYVRRFGSERSPLVIVQNQLDKDRDKGDHPAVVPLRDEFVFCRSVAYSAATNEGREVLDGYLKNAAERFNPPLIGAGRDSVMKRLIAMRGADADLPSDERRYRTLPLQEFESLCKEEGGVSSSGQFLRFLHNAGIVFWRERMFEDQVVLDQAWMLDAIYTVFNREKCLQQLQARAGRFTLSELGWMVWDEHYTADKQALFISFMRSCGISFKISGESDQEPIYVAPDLLPDGWSPAECAERWGKEPADYEQSFSYDCLPPALMRNLICRIGEEAGIRCDYWRNGFYGYEVDTASRLLFEQDIQDDWRGVIWVRTRGGRAQQLLDHMIKFLGEEEQRLGLSGTELFTARAEAEPDTNEVTSESMSFGQAPNQDRIFYVSYAWSDKNQAAEHSRERIVNDFCDAAVERQIKVHRDREDMVIGQRISAFMNRLARADRVIVVLSDKYLKSPFCMYELHEIWLQSRGESDRFLKRVRVYSVEDAQIWSITDRAQYAVHWKSEHEKINSIVQEHGLSVLGDQDKVLAGKMERFSADIGDILGALTDVLQPRGLDELVSYGFDDDVFDDD